MDNHIYAFIYSFIHSSIYLSISIYLVSSAVAPIKDFMGKETFVVWKSFKFESISATVYTSVCQDFLSSKSRFLRKSLPNHFFLSNENSSRDHHNSFTLHPQESSKSFEINFWKLLIKLSLINPFRAKILSLSLPDLQTRLLVSTTSLRNSKVKRGIIYEINFLFISLLYHVYCPIIHAA